MEPGTGLHPRPSSAKSLRQYFSEIDPSWSSIYYPSREGEDVDGCHNRCADFLAALVPELNRRFDGKHKRILLVSHAATIIALNRALLGDRDKPMRVGCCSLSEFKNDGCVKWLGVKIADGAHMKDGSTRDWGFEDIIVENGEVRPLLRAPSLVLIPVIIGHQRFRPTWVREREERSNWSTTILIADVALRAEADLKGL